MIRENDSTGCDSSTASASRPLPAVLTRGSLDELSVLVVMAAREAQPIGATRNLLKMIAKDFVSRCLSGPIEQAVDGHIDRLVRSGLFEVRDGGVQLAQPTRQP